MHHWGVFDPAFPPGFMTSVEHGSTQLPTLGSGAGSNMSLSESCLCESLYYVTCGICMLAGVISTVINTIPQSAL